MGSPGTAVKVRDVAFGAVGERGSYDRLPMTMTCKHGHLVTRHTVALSDLVIPFYPCATCEIVFRYHECTSNEDVISTDPVGVVTASM